MNVSRFAAIIMITAISWNGRAADLNEWTAACNQRLSGARTDLQALVDFLAAQPPGQDETTNLTNQMLAGYPKGVRLLIEQPGQANRAFPTDLPALLENQLPKRLPHSSIVRAGNNEVLYVAYSQKEDLRIAMGIPGSLLFEGNLPPLSAGEGLAVVAAGGGMPLFRHGNTFRLSDILKKTRSTQNGGLDWKEDGVVQKAVWQPLDLSGAACVLIQFSETRTAPTLAQEAPPSEPAPGAPASTTPEPTPAPTEAPGAPLAKPMPAPPPSERTPEAPAPTPAPSPSPAPPPTPSPSPVEDTPPPKPAEPVLQPIPEPEAVPEKKGGLNGDWNGAYSDRLYRATPGAAASGSDALFKVQARVSHDGSTLQMALTFPDGNEILSGSILENEIAAWSSPRPGQRPVFFSGTYDAVRDSVRGTLQTFDDTMILRRTLYLLRLK